jgi:hypothetical protein
LFTKVNGKAVLKRAIPADGVSDLARITGVDMDNSVIYFKLLVS